jgi:polygalacturonase
MWKLTPAMAIVGVLLLPKMNAQDSRSVTEPRFPPACIVLKARLITSENIDPKDEARQDTERIQHALDGCAANQAVELAADGARNAFLTSPIQLRTGVTLLVDKGVTLYASRDPRDFELEPRSCGVVNDEAHGCKPLISGKQASGSAVMGDGVIDGRGGSKLLIDSKEQSKSWWELSAEARKDGHQQNPKLIAIDHSDNFTLYRITLRNSPFFHVTYSNGDGFTVWGVKIDTPQNARNTDGIDPGAAKNITVTQSYIRDGDDNIAIKGGSGPVTNMSVTHNHFYYGHGMSIGSETQAGISALRVNDLTLDGTDAGIRIKSQEAYGGLVHDVLYENICVRNSKTPIQLDTKYSANPKPGKGLIPMFQDIIVRNMRIAGGGTIKLNGFDAAHSIGIRFDDVLLTDAQSKYKFNVSNANVTLGPGAVNFSIQGQGPTESGIAHNRVSDSCATRFVTFPMTK